MRYRLVRVLMAYGVGTLVFLSAGLLAAGPASASAQVNVRGTVVETAQTATSVPATSVPATSPSPEATTDTPTPSPGPADPGTGETGEAKDTRTDFAPAYIAAIAVVVAVVVLILWRRRGKKTIV